jgi:hypothetical protein
MRSTIGSAILLGVLVAAWMFVMGFTGWYKHPKLNYLFFAVVLIEIGVLVAALRASRDATYGRQVGRGVAIAALAGLLIVAASIVFTTVAFPKYFDEIRECHAQLLREQGKSDAEIRQALDAAAPMQKPIPQALAGFVGTVLTGLVASLVIAIFARRRSG